MLSWHNPRLRALVYQALALAAVAFVAWYLVSNTLANLAARHITTGFAFLGRQAGFAIGESLIRYGPTDTFARALWVGILNTLLVAAAGIVLATLLGVLAGIARLSRNGLASRLAAIYIEAIRNTPLLLQLFLWYALITEGLPTVQRALQPLPGVFLSNRGLALPLPFDAPHLQGYGFVGGITLSPEFLALLIGLVIYTGAFIAEVVRAGVLAVDRGQWEAAESLGLRRAAILRLIVLPQALRVIVPPLTNQYLNLVKNSSLAVAIGYPDLVSIANTTLNQTGQAIEGVLIIMAAYLTVSLSISVLMNLYNRRHAS